MFPVWLRKTLNAVHRSSSRSLAEGFSAQSFVTFAFAVCSFKDSLKLLFSCRRKLSSAIVSAAVSCSGLHASGITCSLASPDASSVFYNVSAVHVSHVVYLLPVYIQCRPMVTENRTCRVFQVFLRSVSLFCYDLSLIMTRSETA